MTEQTIERTADDAAIDLGALRSVEDYREEAYRRAPAETFLRMFGAEGDDISRTDAANRAAFAAVGLRPRVLRDVSQVSLRSTLLGQPVEMPVVLAPVGNMIALHPDAELGPARAASSEGVAMALSLAASAAVEDVLRETRSPLWFQLYLLRDRGATQALVEHAEAVGCKAIVVTVDNPGILARDFTPGRRPRYGTIERLGLGASLTGGGVVLENVDPAMSWRDIEWLRSLTSLPIVIKGIQTAEDAELCRSGGAAGLVVSNHGGQTLLDTRGTLTRLAEVADSAGDVEVYLDGGVREGVDVLKALALGARAVLIGRPQYWGVAVDGAAGVRGVLQILHRQLAQAMRFCGVSDITQVSRALVTAPG